MVILSRRKATIAAITVSIIYAICWVPVLVMYYAAQSLPNHMVYSPTHKITVVLAMFNSSINPVVYSFTSARFRQYLIRLLKCKCYTRWSNKGIAFKAGTGVKRDPGEQRYREMGRQGNVIKGKILHRNWTWERQNMLDFLYTGEVKHLIANCTY